MNISADTCLNLYCFNLGHWTTVKPNHVVKIKDTARIFIKATDVQQCKDFEKFLASTSSSATAPNIRTNLAGERAYVRKKMVEYELSQASTPSSVRNKHRLSPENIPSTPKRSRVLLDDTPTPTITSYHTPLPPARFNRRHGTGAMHVVKRKVSAATWEREMVECCDSDAGPEPTLALPLSPLYARPAVKQEDAFT